MNDPNKIDPAASKNVKDEAQRRLEAEILRVGAEKKLEETLDPAKPYEWSTEKDPVGVLFEHPAYADAGCNMCYGRGILRALVGDGYVRLKGPMGGRVSNPQRRKFACGCVTAGYKRVAGMVRSISTQKLVKLMGEAPKDVEVKDDAGIVVGHRVSDDACKRLGERANVYAVDVINKFLGEKK